MKSLQQPLGMLVRLLWHNNMLEQQHNAEMLHSPHSADELGDCDYHHAWSLSHPLPGPANQFPGILDQDLSILAGGKHSIHSDTNKQTKLMKCLSEKAKLENLGQSNYCLDNLHSLPLVTEYRRCVPFSFSIIWLMVHLTLNLPTIIVAQPFNIINP